MTELPRVRVTYSDELVILQSNDVPDYHIVPRLVDEIALPQNLRRSVVHLPVTPVPLL